MDVLMTAFGIRCRTTACTRRRNRVDHNVIEWSDMALLHGPPVPLNTSLFRDVAHQTSVRQVVHGFFLQVLIDTTLNKLFGESSKKMVQLFRAVCNLARDFDFIMILLDEVESLAITYQIGGSSQEAKYQGDFIRLFNATLSELDSIDNFYNLVLIATRNFSNGIDNAFASRPDLTVPFNVPEIFVVHHFLV